MTTGIPTSNKGYQQAAAYYADPNNELIPDETHHEYVKGVHAYMLATAIPAGGGGGGGDVTSEEFLDVKQAQGILAIQQAISAGTTVNSNYLYAVDEFEDETGISAKVATYESGTSSYRTTTASSHSLLIQSEVSPAVYSKFDQSSYNTSSSGSLQINGAQTWACEFYITALPSAFRTLLNNREGVSGRGFQIDINSSNQIRMFGNTGGGSIFSTFQLTGSHVNTWVKVIGTVTGIGGSQSVEVFIEGASGGADTGATIASADDFYIGHNPDTAGREFDGRLRNIEIYSGKATDPANWVPGDTDSMSGVSIIMQSEDGSGFDNDQGITFTETSGKVVRFVDASFSDGTETHTPTANGDVSNVVNDAKFGSSSIYFDGSGAYISIPDSADWHPDSGSYTVEAWVKVPNVSGTKTIISQSLNTGSQRAWMIRIDDDEVRMYYYTATGAGNGGSEVIASSTTGPISANTWHHVAFDIDTDNTTLRLYVDGVVEYIDASFTASIIDSTAQLAVGCYNQGGTPVGFFNGFMEEVRVLKGSAEYAGAFTPPTAPYNAGYVSNIELDSITFTAGTAPTKATIVVVMEPIDSVTINTDFLAYVSPTASFANKATFTLTYAGIDPLSGGNIYTSDDVDLSGLTSGTDMRYYIRGANEKDLRVHAVYLYYAG